MRQARLWPIRWAQTIDMAATSLDRRIGEAPYGRDAGAVGCCLPMQTDAARARLCLVEYSRNGFARMGLTFQRAAGSDDENLALDPSTCDQIGVELYDRKDRHCNRNNLVG